MDIFDLIVIGGGASGFMSAITASDYGVKKIKIMEASPKFLEKVRISGGGRCNITNASWLPNELIENYPRGGVKLLESFSRFATGDVYEWFESRGLSLKIESDQRVFPSSNSSMDVIKCLKQGAINGGIDISAKSYVKKILKDSNNLFKVFSHNEQFLLSKKILISTGGHPSGHKLAKSFGHNIIKPIPSLFTFTYRDDALTSCSGAAIKNINLKIKLNKKIFQNKGDLLITHWGFSGPGILKLSAMAARELYFEKYKFKLVIHWCDLDANELKQKINNLREINGKLNLENSRPLPFIPKRLWVFILKKIGINEDKKWSEIVSSERDSIIKVLLKDEYIINGKGPFGEEFVTAGGIDINEVNFKTMESLLIKGLYFSGEVLNIDGITGGFNFQHCWTSGWLSGKAIAGERSKT